MSKSNINRDLNGLNPLSYMGVTPTTPPQQVEENRVPTVNDYQGYPVGTIWMVKGTDDVYMLTQKTGNVATWTALAQTGPLPPVVAIGDILAGTAPNTIGVIDGSTAHLGDVLTGSGANILPTWQPGTSINMGSTEYAVQVGGALGTITSLASNGLVGQLLTSGGAAADPEWSTTTFPVNTVETGDILAGTATNVIGVIDGLTADMNYVLAGNGAGVLPSWKPNPGGVGDVPIGGYIGWPAAVAPANYLLTNGAYLDSTTYADLYAVCGDQYGTGLIDEFLPVASSGFLPGEQINDIIYANGMWIAVGGVPGTSARMTMAVNPRGVWADVTLSAQWATNMITRISYMDVAVLSPWDGIFTIAGENGKCSMYDKTLATKVDMITTFGASTIRAIACCDNLGGYTLWMLFGDGHKVSVSGAYPYNYPLVSWTAKDSMTGLSGTIYDAKNDNDGYTNLLNTNRATGTDTKANISKGAGGNAWPAWTLTALNGALGATTLKSITRLGGGQDWVYTGTAASGIYVDNSGSITGSTLTFDITKACWNSFNNKYIAVGPSGVVEYVIGMHGKTAAQAAVAMTSATNGFGSDDVLAVATDTVGYTSGSEIIIGGEGGRIEYATYSGFRLPTIASTIIRYQYNKEGPRCLIRGPI
jgi:hypothetical protein